MTAAVRESTGLDGGLQGSYDRLVVEGQRSLACNGEERAFFGRIVCRGETASDLGLVVASFSQVKFGKEKTSSRVKTDSGCGQGKTWDWGWRSRRDMRIPVPSGQGARSTLSCSLTSSAASAEVGKNRGRSPPSKKEQSKQV